MSRKKIITKAEKREILIQKEKIKEQQGGTLAGQMSRLKTSKNYAGKKK